MKLFTLLSISLLIAHFGYGQSTEYSLHLNSGFAAYQGRAAAQGGTALTVPDPFDVYLYSDREEPHTSNPYGTTLGLSYGLAAQAQRVTARGSLWGLQAGYEVLRSRARIRHVFDQVDFGSSSTGYTTMINRCTTAHPFFGHRFAIKRTQVDLTAGPEVSFLHRSHEKGEAKTDFSTYSTRLHHAHPDLDVRARVNATTSYQRLGLALGYSRGFTNHRKGQAGVRGEAYLQVFRLGLSYRL
ncbi:hypothetical protein [Hymenobacter sp.]|uniref:hypothetical protein n=1 Tax=Hymenobacter sp. TaxID=1898978 RepID=UPI00286C5439|nr:hypothetical protein [Hymenobacter sp.]